MIENVRLIKNPDGSYDLAIYMDKYDEEFSGEFLANLFSRERFNKLAKAAKLNAVKVIASGVLIASVPFAMMKNVFAAESKYSMAYLYGGSQSQYTQYVQNTKQSLNAVSPSYFDIVSGGRLQINSIDKNFVNSMHAQNITVVPFLSNHWDRTAGIAALNDPEGLASNLANAIASNNLDGINVDIENVTHNERDRYTQLVAALRQKLPSNKEVSVAVAANPSGWTTGWHGSYDYAKLAQNSDYLMIMTYDEHYEGGDPGPVASINFVENSVKYALKYTTGDKIVIGLPFFGRVWSDNGLLNGNGLNMTQIDVIIKEHNAKITYDAASKSPKAEFTVTASDAPTTVAGKPAAPGHYVIWYENEQSIKEKLALVNKYNLKGAGSWSVGKENLKIWDNYSEWLNGVTSAPVTASPVTPATPSQTQPVVKPSTPVAPATPAVTTPAPAKPAAPTPAPVVAEKKGSVTSATLNVRSAAKTNASIVATIKKGNTVTILSTSGDWHKVRLSNGKTGYVHKNYIKIASASTAAKPAAVKTKTTKSTLNIRVSASSSAKKLGSVAKNKSVQIYETKGSYTKITYGKITGYVLTSGLK